MFSAVYSPSLQVSINSRNGHFTLANLAILIDIQKVLGAFFGWQLWLRSDDGQCFVALLERIICKFMGIILIQEEYNFQKYQ